mgnify:CR=1 FL=1
MNKPLRVIEAYYLDSSGIRRPLVVLSWDDYFRLSQVNQVGQINSYFVNKQQFEALLSSRGVANDDATTC